MDISATRRSATAFDRRYWLGGLWPRWSWTIEKFQWDARYRAWLRKHKPYLFASREDAYRAVNPEGPVCYLEFGVYKGESLLTWSRLNHHVGTRLHGFDSFQGQRGEPGSPFNEGSFALNDIPTFDDQRIKLHVGWVETTLPKFTGYPVHQEDTLILNMDMDDFAPTLFVLTFLHRQLRPGTIVLFDEMSVAECEFQAFLHWVQAYRREYIVRAAWQHGRRVEGAAIELL